MSNVAALVDEARSLGATLEVHGETVKVKAPAPLPAELMADLRQHKQEIIARLTPRRYQRTYPGDAAGDAELAEIERRVEAEGLCVFWADLFGELVAFIADEVFRDQVPAGVVCYTVGELEMLFGDREAKPSDSALKLIHEGKKLGGRIVDHWTEGDGDGDG